MESKNVYCCVNKCKNFVKFRVMTSKRHLLCSMHMRDFSVELKNVPDKLYRWCYYCKKVHPLSSFNSSSMRVCVRKNNMRIVREKQYRKKSIDAYNAALVLLSIRKDSIL